MKNILNGIKNNQLLRLIVFFVTFCSINLFPMRMPEIGKALAKRWTGQSQRKEAISRKRGLLIFLDDQEQKEIGAIGGALVTALYQEASPIIVSNSLLYTLIQQREKDKRNINISLNELATEYFDKGWSHPLVLQKDHILMSRIGFQPERWIIKKINDSLMLLLPKQYIESLFIDSNKVQEWHKGSGLPSEVELKLGFKINHMKTIIFEEINSAHPVVFADYFIDSLENIFCKKSDYKHANINIPEWFIYINGHGSINYSIAHLSLDGFKRFLNFLERTIIMRLLVVVSCQVAGVNSNKIYGEMKLATAKQYLFPIIIQGLNDVSALNGIPSVDCRVWKRDKIIKLKIHNDFLNFIKKAKTLDGNYSEIISPIWDHSIENTPQIKLPGIEWFSVIDADKRVASIGSIFAKTRDPQKPLYVYSFFKKYPEIILLYTDDIPFELKINYNRLSSIISMVSSGPFETMPDFVVHRIEKISSIERFSEVLRWFKLIGDAKGSKMFFIDIINADTDSYKDILIFGNETSDTIYYFKDKNNVLFRAELKAEERRAPISKIESASEFEIADYEIRMQQVQQYLEKSKEIKKEKQEITPEKIKEIENVLTKQLEEQKEREGNVSEPSVD